MGLDLSKPIRFSTKLRWKGLVWVWAPGVPVCILNLGGGVWVWTPTQPANVIFPRNVGGRVWGCPHLASIMFYEIGVARYGFGSQT